LGDELYCLGRAGFEGLREGGRDEGREGGREGRRIEKWRGGGGREGGKEGFRIATHLLARNRPRGR
jgi:hypothetical protein